MDTRTHQSTIRQPANQGQADIARIQQGQQMIKMHMPQVYALIKEAAEVRGNEVWAHVRRGLAGEPGFFWAVENGVTQGTPFTGQPAWQAIGATLCSPNCACVCIMAPAGAGAGG